MTSILSTVGNTPLVKLQRIIPQGHAEVFVKCEFFNPLSSVKDRIGLAMIEAAEQEGKLDPSRWIIEPTSGNTGIALAFIAAAKGYRLTLVIPESVSVERRALLLGLGADYILTSARYGVLGSIRTAEQLCSKNPNMWMPRQFENPANPRIHEVTTGPEIWAASNCSVDIVVAGVGTGGTITGVTRYLRLQNPQVEAIAVEPSESAVLSGCKPGAHRIQGIGAGFIPANLDTTLLNGIETVSSEESFAWARRLASEEGILGGISTGANVAVAARVAAIPWNRGKKIVTFACSAGERYLSTPLYDLIGSRSVDSSFENLNKSVRTPAIKQIPLQEFPSNHN